MTTDEKLKFYKESLERSIASYREVLKKADSTDGEYTYTHGILWGLESQLESFTLYFSKD